MSRTPSSARQPASDPNDPFTWLRDSRDAAVLRREVAAQLQARRRKRVRGAASAIIVAFLLAWVLPLAWQTHTVSIPAGQRTAQVLSDGSQVEINARSELWTDFRYGRRIVKLNRGEAFFSVAHDSARPFLVQTPRGVVRVTGTEFNVKIGADGHPIVTLLQGSVAIHDAGPRPLTLAPGEQFDAAAADAPRRLDPAEIDRATAWRRGRIILDGLTVGEAVRTVAAYHDKRYEVSPEAARLILGGVCALENWDDFLSAIAEAVPVQIQAAPDLTRITTRPPAAARP